MKTKCYSLTELNISDENPQHYEITNMFCMRQNYSSITWPTLKACCNKRTKLHALTYITLIFFLSHPKNKYSFPKEIQKHMQIKSRRESTGQQQRWFSVSYHWFGGQHSWDSKHSLQHSLFSTRLNLCQLMLKQIENYEILHDMINPRPDDTAGGSRLLWKVKGRGEWDFRLVCKHWL